MKMARERWTTDIKCNGCKTEGTARWSENDYPFMKNLDRQVYVEGPFTVVEDGKDDYFFKCDGCGELIG